MKKIFVFIMLAISGFCHVNSRGDSNAWLMAQAQRYTAQSEAMHIARSQGVVQSITSVCSKKYIFSVLLAGAGLCVLGVGAYRFLQPILYPTYMVIQDKKPQRILCTNPVKSSTCTSLKGHYIDGMEEAVSWLRPRTAITKIIFSPDNAIMATGSWDSSIKLWDPKTGILIKELYDETKIKTGSSTTGIKKAGGPVKRIAFSNDGKRLISVLEANYIQEWDITSRTCLSTNCLKGAGRSYGVALSEDNKMVAIGGSDTDIDLFSTGNGKLIKRLKSKTGDTCYLAFNPVDSNMMISAHRDKLCQLWDIAQARPVAQFNGDRRAVFSHDGTRIASLNDRSTPTIHVYTLQKNKSLKSLGTLTETAVLSTGSNNDSIKYLAFHPTDKNMLLIGFNNCKIEVWNVEKGVCVASFDDPSEKTTTWVNAVSLNNDQTKIVAGLENGKIKIWDWPQL